MSTRAWLCALILVSVSDGAQSAETWRDRFQIHGFASQAATRTSANRWFGNSPNTSFDFTELGVNASLRLTPRILLAAQALSLRAGEMSDGSPTLDYGLADATLNVGTEHRLGLRVGRIKNPAGLYNETRDVPFTHPGIFLPQVVYFDRVRNLILSSDGVMLYADVFGERGSANLALGIGRPVLDENVEWSFLLNDFPGDLEAGKNTVFARLWYNTPGERLRIGLSGGTLGLAFSRNRHAPLTLDNGTLDLFYWIASLQYNAEHWTLSAEYAGQPLSWRDFGPLFPNRDVTTEGYYVQGTYRVRSDVELMLRAEKGFGDRGDRSGERFSVATGGTPRGPRAGTRCTPVAARGAGPTSGRGRRSAGRARRRCRRRPAGRRTWPREERRSS